MRKNLAVATSDWHITADRPRNRLPGYQQQQYDKVQWILETTKDLGAVLLNAGDIFDRAREPRSVTNKYMKLFRQYDIEHYACAGQHDQTFQSRNLSDTSIGQLFAAGFIDGDNGGISFVMGENPGYGVCKFDWGNDKLFYEVGMNVVVAHFCVTERPIEFIDYSLTAEEFMKKAKARIMVTGDYHTAHTLKKDGRLLVNPGSIMRNASDTIQKKPSVYLIDLDTAEVVDQLEIPILPASEVFNMDQIDREKKHRVEKQLRTQQFEEYAANVQKSKDIKVDFVKELNQVITHVNPDDLVKVEIDTIMGEV